MTVGSGHELSITGFEYRVWAKEVVAQRAKAVATKSLKFFMVSRNFEWQSCR